MKNLLLVAALTVAAAPAMASKARLSALGNSAQLVDVQNTFEKPYQMHSVGELVTMEWGTSGDGAANRPHAEGGFIKAHGESVYGVYFGRKSTDFNTAISLANTGFGSTLLEEQNPINLMYGMKSGDLAWGATLKYSNGKNDTGDKKVSSAGFSAGVTNGTWDANLVVGLAGKSEQTAVTVENKSNIKIGGGYKLTDAQYVYADFKTAKVEGDTTATPALDSTVEKTIINVGFVNTVVKNDDVNFFYGVAYGSDKTKDGDEVQALPVWMGIEANATSWMVLRASVKQSVLINETKTAAGAKSDLDSVTFNAGAGLKLGKGMLDANFGTANKGQLNFGNGAAGQEFLTNVAYTYMF
ncbi:MAG: hypothetical protein HUU57_01795 [Bdellovibrio sp.]|nr:hypothetical protein [Bdellovibrio sp.]